MPCSTVLDSKALHLRRKVLDIFLNAGRGHLLSAFSCLDIISVLYDSVLQVRPDEPDWPLRDRFILSKGHGALALYTILSENLFFSGEELETFCNFASKAGGHPERNALPGIEASTGSLGHGPSLGVGMALAARLDRRASRVFVLCGDGETNEGSVWEACLYASKYALTNFTLLIDYNKQQSWGNINDIMPLEPYADKFRAFGFAVEEVDGHDTSALRETFSRLPFHPEKPSCLICHTTRGKGIPFLEGNLDWHHKARLSTAERSALESALHAGALS